MTGLAPVIQYLLEKMIEKFLLKWLVVLPSKPYIQVNDN